jgi:TonB family protein
MLRTAVGVGLAVTAVAWAAPQADDVVAASDAGAHVGKRRIVCADVAAVRRDGKDIILELFAAPRPPVLVVVSSKARQLFVTAFENAAMGWNVCARGKIEKKPEGLRVKIDDGLMLRAVERPPSGRAGFAAGIPAAQGAGITWPKPITRPNPKYTSNGMKAKIQGDMSMEGVVQPDGTVGDVRVVKSLDPLFGLDAEAVKSFKQWRFTPATRDGQPIAVVVTVEMSFRLH